jgi:hypothetical protein
MRIERVIDQERYFIHTTITGEITLPEIREDMVRLAADPHYSPDMPGIVDMRNAKVNLSSNEIRQLTDSLKQSPRVVSNTRRALLVGSDLAFGIYRMFVAMAENGRTDYRVFREEQAARDWLDELILKRRMDPM